MKVGRNDPCACGSGKKYKQCCLVQKRGDEMLWHRQRRLNDELPQSLFKFAVDTLGPDALDEAWQEFFLFDKTQPIFDQEDPNLPLFMPWFFYEWEPDPQGTKLDIRALNGKGIAGAYLEKGKNLQAFEREYLQSCLASAFSFHEIVNVQPGEGFLLRDIFCANELHVTEKTGSQQATVGDLLFARVVPLNGVSVLDGCAPVVIPGQAKKQPPITDLRKNIQRNVDIITPEALHLYRFEMFELYHLLTSHLLYLSSSEFDDPHQESLVHHEILFDIDSPQTAYDALKDLFYNRTPLKKNQEDILLAEADFDAHGNLCAIDFPWLEPDNPSDDIEEGPALAHIFIEYELLVIEASANTNTETLRAIIEKRMGAAARHQQTTLQSDDGELDLAALAALEHIETQTHFEQQLQNYYREWPDLPTPLLDDQTPRDVVNDPESREMVKRMLEQIGADLGEIAPTHCAPIIQKLTTELGLDPVQLKLRLREGGD